MQYNCRTTVIEVLFLCREGFAVTATQLGVVEDGEIGLAVFAYGDFDAVPIAFVEIGHGGVSHTVAEKFVLIIGGNGVTVLVGMGFEGAELAEIEFER